MNIEACFFPEFSLDICPTVGFLYYMIAQFLVFCGTSMLFSIVAIPTYIPSNNVEGILFLHTLSSIYYYRCWWSPFWCELIPPCVLICISLIISDAKHLFLCLLVILCLLWGNVYVGLCPLCCCCSYWVVWGLGRFLRSIIILSPINRKHTQTHT